MGYLFRVWLNRQGLTLQAGTGHGGDQYVDGTDVAGTRASIYINSA